MSKAMSNLPVLSPVQYFSVPQAQLVWTSSGAVATRLLALLSKGTNPQRGKREQFCSNPFILTWHFTPLRCVLHPHYLPSASVWTREQAQGDYIDTTRS